MPGPLRLQSQDRLCYAGHDAGSRGARHGCVLELPRPGSRLRASPRHHAYLSGRAVCRPRRDRCGLALAPQPAQAAGHRAALGLAVALVLVGGPEPHLSRLDQQLRRSPLLSLQSALVRAGHRLHHRARRLCCLAAWPGRPRDLRAGRPGNRRRQALVPRTRLGDCRAGAGRASTWACVRWSIIGPCT